MPIFITNKILIVVVVILTLNLSFAKPAVADTDPQSATPTISATIPATAPSEGDTIAPTTPILVAPDNHALLNYPRPEFVWRTSSDPNGNTVTYTLYLNGVATYLGISNIGNSSGSGYTARLDGPEIILTPTSDLPDGTYTWYVVASDPSHNTASSTTWTFTIDTVPPPLSLTQLAQYANPVIFEGANFDIPGPNFIPFTLLSEPNATVQLTLTSATGEVWLLSGVANSSGIVSFSQYLVPGRYVLTLVAIDLAGNTTALPLLTLTIIQAQLTIPLPPVPGLPPSYEIPYPPVALSFLPSTIAQLESRLSLSSLLPILLALIVAILLLLLWRRKPNLILLQTDGTPIQNAQIYHSRPNPNTRYKAILVTKHSPLSYILVPSDRGQLYIGRLSRYSTLTIDIGSDDPQTPNQVYLLSLSASKRVYVIHLG